ncbi:hypothetical protein BZM27_42825 [Paraburkholderia steynii]|uniref:Uncharacterized protein n=1 Tax=Paraburkholderia steynii TaxID=1245441 RepID=A0A4R0XDU5_9BURK|nr:hypothetical protein BZM27_42825 [Paraburkholderia steynii]
MKMTVVVSMLVVFATLRAHAQAAEAPAAASGVTALLGAPVPATVVRGGQVTVTGDNLPSVSAVQLCADTDPTCDKPNPAPTAESSSKSLKFAVPPALKPGTYRVGLIVSGAKPSVFTSAPIDVTRAAPVISALSDTTLYPKGINEKDYASLIIQGSGFATAAENAAAKAANKGSANQILINDVPLGICGDATKTR